MHGWIDVQMEWMNKWMNGAEWVKNWIMDSEWMNEWMNECVLCPALTITGTPECTDCELHDGTCYDLLGDTAEGDGVPDGCQCSASRTGDSCQTRHRKEIITTQRVYTLFPQICYCCCPFHLQNLIPVKPLRNLRPAWVPQSHMCPISTSDYFRTVCEVSTYSLECFYM